MAEARDDTRGPGSADAARGEVRERNAPEPHGGARADDTASDEEIRRRAYELYVSRGGRHGSDMDDWLAAERELRSRTDRSAGPERADAGARERAEERSPELADTNVRAADGAAERERTPERSDGEIGAAKAAPKRGRAPRKRTTRQDERPD